MRFSTSCVRRAKDSGAMSGQASILEYALMVFFVIIIIVALMVFLSYWQLTQLRVEETRVEMDRALFITKATITLV